MHSTKLLAKYEKNYPSKFFSFIAGVVDTADKHSYREFSKKTEMSLTWYSLARGNLIHEKKLEAENLVSGSL